GSGPGSQVPKVCFFGGNQKKFARRSMPVLERICFGRNRNPCGREAKQKTECRRATDMPRTGDRVRTGIKHGGRSWAESVNGYDGVRLRPPYDDVLHATRSHANESAVRTKRAFTTAKSSA